MTDQGGDLELKRRYLSQLPPTQIIDICLRFDAYALPYVKHNVWPVDLHAAIAALQSAPSSPENAPTPPPVTDEPATKEPTIKAEEDVSSEQESKVLREPEPPEDKDPNQSPSTSASCLPLYPTPYPVYYVPTNTFQLHPDLNNLNINPKHHNPFPDPEPAPSAAGGPDDLPNYEEMLVTALTELDGPEGSAPKRIYTWMETKYPLHNNFRPSASQALQKAYRKGRVEKSAEGKYRLNASWDGVYRRTTRRPQTQSTVNMNNPFPLSKLPSPFTTVPRALAQQTAPPKKKKKKGSAGTRKSSAAPEEEADEAEDEEEEEGKPQDSSTPADKEKEKLSTTNTTKLPPTKPPILMLKPQPKNPESSSTQSQDKIPEIDKLPEEQQNSNDWEAAQTIFKALGLLQGLSTDVYMQDASATAGLTDQEVSAREELQALFAKLLTQLEDVDEIELDNDDSVEKSTKDLVEQGGLFGEDSDGDDDMEEVIFG